MKAAWRSAIEGANISGTSNQGSQRNQGRHNAPMYLEHFGLTEPPFRITPHTEFFFPGANRGATLDALAYAVTSDEGIVKVSGEVGSGKTILCRMLMERLPSDVRIVYLANPSLSRKDILYAIAAELELELPERARTSTVLRRLQDRLVELCGSGQRVLVLIDEAHAMPTATLEEIRLLSNLESDGHKLMQLVMFGQPELNAILARQEMRQLRERITHNFALTPLDRDEVSLYLDFRMRAAGHKGASIFSPAAVKLIASASLGLTRRINILADKALLAAFAAQNHQVGPREVRAAIRDSDFAVTHHPQRRQVLLAGAAGATVTLAIVAAILSGHLGNPSPAGDPPRASAAALPAAEPAALPAPAPAHDTAPATPPPAPKPEIAPPEALPGWPELGPLTRTLVVASRDWLVKTPAERWFLQFIRTDVAQSKQTEAVIETAQRLVDGSLLHAYAIELAGGKRLGVVYGDFPSEADAVAAVATLPQEIRQLGPYPRQVGRLR